jgi:hypothetical protein
MLARESAERLAPRQSESTNFARTQIWGQNHASNWGQNQTSNKTRCARLPRQPRISGGSLPA